MSEVHLKGRAERGIASTTRPSSPRSSATTVWSSLNGEAEAEGAKPSCLSDTSDGSCFLKTPDLAGLYQDSSAPQQAYQTCFSTASLRGPAVPAHILDAKDDCNDGAAHMLIVGPLDGGRHI